MIKFIRDMMKSKMLSIVTPRRNKSPETILRIVRGFRRFAAMIFAVDHGWASSCCLFEEFAAEIVSHNTCYDTDAKRDYDAKHRFHLPSPAKSPT